jgi:hypothetical protein
MINEWTKARAMGCGVIHLVNSQGKTLCNWWRLNPPIWNPPPFQPKFKPCPKCKKKRPDLFESPGS